MITARNFVFPNKNDLSILVPNSIKKAKEFSWISTKSWKESTSKLPQHFAMMENGVFESAQLAWKTFKR